MITEIGLGLSIVSAGLWSGLLLTLATILHPRFATPAAMPADWRAARRRRLTLNRIRGVLTWTAFAPFLAASHVNLRAAGS